MRLLLFRFFAHFGCEWSFLWHSTVLQCLYPVPGFWFHGELRDQTTLRIRQSSGVSAMPMSKRWCQESVHLPAAVALVSHLYRPAGVVSSPSPTLSPLTTCMWEKKKKKIANNWQANGTKRWHEEKRTMAKKIDCQRIYNNALDRSPPGSGTIPDSPVAQSCWCLASKLHRLRTDGYRPRQAASPTRRRTGRLCTGIKKLNVPAHLPRCWRLLNFCWHT